MATEHTESTENVLSITRRRAKRVRRNHPFRAFRVFRGYPSPHASRLTPHSSLIRRPAEAASSTKPGKEVLTLAQSSMSMGPVARKAAMAKDIAMR